MEQIVRLVELIAEARNCTASEIFSAGRRAPIAEARQIAMHIARRLTWMSYPQLADSWLTC